jgi:hypothetical protein
LKNGYLSKKVFHNSSKFFSALNVIFFTLLPG